ncbi:hypothetical protein PIB30_000058 [Stylosanthes scabra]|uniref:Uncharacterized protein n=1 Tax=Stylosanthes scabra TaxID=79078 RepID=A0ABU6Q3C0_9FABA|nr:hypothetical protein [Stylosanthes scabra]
MDATRQFTPLEKTRLGNRFKDSNCFVFSSTFHKTASTIKANPDEHRSTTHHFETERGEHRRSQIQSRRSKKLKQGHHFRCLPKTVATMYNECLRKNEEKMALVEELGFGAFSHLPDYNLKQHMLKELVNIYDIHDNTIHSVRGDVQITTDKIGKALGLSWNGDPFDERVSEKDLNDEDYAIFKIFQGKSQADLTMLVKRTPVDTKANRNLFKRTFLFSSRRSSS